MTEMLHLTCPGCGADMTVSADGKTAVCEFCGHRALLREKQKTETKTETQKMIERIREERASQQSQPAPVTPDELRGGILAAISAFFMGTRYRLRQMARYIVFVAAAAAAYILIRGLLPEQYYSYLPIAGLILSGVGVFCVIISYSSFRSLPLGLGVGALIVWLMQLTGTLR
ncbi:MAG: hypothetical protein IJL26_09050 [Clostridia bacterium]|nr:hypothetical protein [Clostridia bacterium]